MKRGIKITVPLLLLAVMLITALSVFMFTATAADSDEATLTVATINYGTDTEKESYGYEVSTTQVSTKTGSFEELASELAALAPEADTRYTLKLNKDVTVDTALAIAGNEHSEIWIDLGGHTLSSTVDGPMLTASGSGATIRIWGEFNDDGSYGKFTTSAANGAFVKIAEGSADRVDVKYVDATFSGNAEGSALFIAEGGKLIIQHSVVNYTSGNNAAAVKAVNAAVDLKYSEFWGGKNLTLVNSSASKVYIEGGEMIGAYIVDSDATKSSIVMTGFACEVDTAFKQGSSDTTTYILGSLMEIYTSIASGEANANNLVFYYGDGSTSIIGQDPSAYGLGNTDCSYVEDGGVYTMVSTSSQVAVATVVTVGSAPETAYYTVPDTALEASLAGVGTDMRTVTDSTLRVVALVNDYSSGATNCTSVTYTGGEDASVIFDLNGHNITYTSSDTKGSGFFTVSFGMHFTLDGADTAGNIGTIKTACRYARIVYARQSSNSGQINYHNVCTVKNLNVVATALYHSTAESTHLFWITAGYAFVDNVSITYTGETTTTMAATSLPMFTLGHTPFKKGVAFINNLSISSTSTLGVPVYGLKVTESWRVFADGYKTSKLGIAATVSASGGMLRLENGTIHSDDVVFSGAGNVHVYDCSITTDTGVISSGSVTPTFYYGTGKNVVYTGGAVMSGNTAAEEGYGMGPVSEGVYKLISESDAHTLTMPAIFGNGMMLQRNKQANVYGYCQDIGATVRVTIGNQVVETTVDANGKWVASFAPMEAARGVSIAIKQLGKGQESIPDILYEDVDIGEIWVMSGQSNAELRVGYLEDVEELALLSETLNIREFRQTGSAYSILPDTYGTGTWKRVTSSSVRSTAGTAMSAIGYATVAKLAVELGSDVPVGLITVAQGSTKIKTWLDYDALYELSPSEAAKYDECVATNTLPEKPHTKIGTILYNKQIHPLEGFTTAGVMWYQGCGDIPGKGTLGTEGSTYTDYFKALEKVYRRVFNNGGEDLPFYVMQLAPYSRSGDGPSNGGYVYTFKYEQFDFCRELDNTYLVPVAIDGMAFTSQDIEASAFIHPARKSPVANRTADMILANEYGIKFADVVTYPEPLSAVRNSDGTVTVTFDTELKLFYGDSPDGFELTADGTTWVKATGRIEGNKLILSGVSGATGVRYGAGRTQIELRDGTVIEVAHAAEQYTLSADESYYTVTDAVTGNQYVINVDSTDCIRTKNDGNITNASGIPLVLFSMDVVAE